MAVCGRCLLCGYKFNGKKDDGTEPDCAVRWECKSDLCAARVAHARTMWDEVFEHKICTECHDGLVNGTLNGAVGDLLALLARRDER